MPDKVWILSKNLHSFIAAWFLAKLKGIWFLSLSLQRFGIIRGPVRRAFLKQQRPNESCERCLVNAFPFEPIGPGNV